MNPLVVLTTALSSLAGNKLRASLTVLGIVIGVAAVISLMAIGRGAQAAITSNIESLGTNLLFVRPGSSTLGGISGGLGSAASLTVEDAYALVDPMLAPDVAAVAPELRASAQVVAGRENTRTQVIGVTPEYRTVRNYPVEFGQFIGTSHVSNQSNVAVLGAGVSEDLFGNRNPVGQPVRINGREFTVIGVLESKGGSFFGSQDDQVLVPITTMYYRLASQRTPSGGISVQTVNVQAASNDRMDKASDQIATVLRLRHRITDDDDFIITSQQDAIQTLEQTTNAFVVFLGAIASISLLVGGIGIMNIMLVSVTERTREIGIRKAMGAKRRDILLQFVSEAALLSFVGGGVGVLMGYLLAQSVNGRSFGGQAFQTSFSGDIAILALAVSVMIGLFFGIYPAMRAARLHPIEALRYE